MGKKKEGPLGLQAWRTSNILRISAKWASTTVPMVRLRTRNKKEKGRVQLRNETWETLAEEMSLTHYLIIDRQPSSKVMITFQRGLFIHIIHPRHRRCHPIPLIPHDELMNLATINPSSVGGQGGLGSLWLDTPSSKTPAAIMFGAVLLATAPCRSCIRFMVIQQRMQPFPSPPQQVSIQQIHLQVQCLPHWRLAPEKRNPCPKFWPLECERTSRVKRSAFMRK